MRDKAYELVCMERYRILGFNHVGKVFAESTFEAEDDSAAEEYAARQYATANGMGYEIRLGPCLVRRVIFGTENSPA